MASPPRLPPRKKDAHKASVGRVLVVGGSRGMAGAPSLAARGALRVGAGLVTIAVPANVVDVVAGFLAEAMTAPLPCDAGGSPTVAAVEVALALSERADAVVIGPGLGRRRATLDFVRSFALACAKPLVVDADGLFAYRGDASPLAQRGALTVLTPHEGEAADLLGVVRGDGPVDRKAWVERIARACGGICVLKGPGTLVSDGRKTARNATGGPVLATAGTGDVLSGVLAALLAAAVPGPAAALLAVRTAVHVHGLAGDLLARARGDRGVLAGEVADALPVALRSLVRGRGR
jgi:ADP-dependent NAD(P)H-hydrate dehydratase / NAD(P)H-hydrate epimerase